MSVAGQAVTYGAPGRINLIGEHTDYNMGFALPIALPGRTAATFLPEDTGVITVRSDRENAEVAIPLDTTPGHVGGWAAFVAGVMWALRQAGHRITGGRMSIRDGVETGAGLASSAALECAALGAIAAAVGLRIGGLERARLAQRAENEYVGAPTGLLDQLAVLYGEPYRALLIDFREMRIEPVPFDPDAAGVALLVIDSRARHRHAGGEYVARRGSCERAAADLSVASLREVQGRTLSVLGAVADPTDARRARHVLTENQRVHATVAALRHGDFADMGRLLTESHASMRDDFEITTGHIDLIADTAMRAGALGARMTGGGFGGCVIALAPSGRADGVGDAVRRAVTAAGHDEPSVTRTHAAAGAGSMR